MFVWKAVLLRVRSWWVDVLRNSSDSMYCSVMQWKSRVLPTSDVRSCYSMCLCALITSTRVRSTAQHVEPNPVKVGRGRAMAWKCWAGGDVTVTVISDPNPETS